MIFIFFKKLLNIICISLIFTSCATLELLEKKPELNFRDIKLVDFDFQSIDLDIIYEINNPYSFSFLLDSVSYTLKIEDSQILDSDLSLDRMILPLQISSQNMRLHLTYVNIGRIFNQLLLKKQIKVQIDGQAKLGLPANLSMPQSLNIPFSYNKNLVLVAP